MAINPIEVITRTRSRIARLAAISAALYFIAPAITAAAMGAMLPAIGDLTWDRFGYVLRPETMDWARIGLFAVAGIILGAGVVLAWLAWRASSDFIGAAEQIDRKLKAHEQVVTLADLAAPDAPDAVRARRSSLFPMLWRNVIGLLAAFDPRREFALELGRPLARSSAFAAAIAVALGIAMLALVEPPTPLMRTVMRLRDLADKIDQSAATEEDHALAQAVRKVASDLLKPKLPPEEKQKEIENVMRQVDQREAASKQQPGQQSSAAAGSSSGNGASQKGTGQGQGAGQGNAQKQNGQGQGKGEGPGGKKQDGKKEPNNIELRNELAKAEAQVQTEEQTPNQTGAKPSPAEKTGSALQPGTEPNKKGGNEKQMNQKGTAPMPVPQPGANVPNKMPSGQGDAAKKGGSQGDTHLGEFPAPATYQRFLKPGEKGEAVTIKDARYVTFRIPTMVASGSEGKTVTDTERPKASTPYSNAPLAPSADNAPPDERQLVPPRYRDLIR